MPSKKRKYNARFPAVSNLIKIKYKPIINSGMFILGANKKNNADR